MASPHWKHPSVLRIISVAGAATVMGLPDNVATSNTISSTRTDTINTTRMSNGPGSLYTNQLHSNTNSNSMSMSSLLQFFGRPKITEMEATAANINNVTPMATTPTPSDNKQKPMKEYDFVIVGHGIAGKSAVDNLQKLCPQATIAVIDPMMAFTKKNVTSKANKNVDFYETRCEGFHPLTRQVQLLQGNSTNTIRYQHAILVATGSRGAPPPHYLLDEKAWSRILELRPTILPPPPGNDSATNLSQRPILDPTRIRQTVLKAARKGDSIAVVGSGWDAIELAVAISAHSKKRKVGATLVFGGKGPLSHVLPQYLSAAVAKRLTSTKHAIPIHHRSLIRYIGSDQIYTDGGQDEQQVTGLQLYTAKSYDLLDASRTAVQWLVVAPEISGSMGTATLPTASTPSYLQAAQDGRSWYQTWSHLTSTATAAEGDNATPTIPTANLVACYADDGRIAVNAELSAGNGVYAAGSVAKFPNPWTGNADVAGVGMEDGTEAGSVAARNMARDYQHRTGKGNKGGILSFGGRHTTEELSRDMAHLKHPIPIRRSDQSVLSSSAASNNNSLKDAGIYALCIGSCDSERFSTQAFWWTNQSKRMKQWLEDDDSKKTGPRRRRTGRLATNPASSLRPVYGRGIVYYMDQEAGQIQGIMIWGFPFTDGSHSKGTNDNQPLNPELVQHLQKIIQTNGGFRNLGQDSELERVNFVQYLTETSRQLVVKAIEPFAASSQGIQPDDLPRPLIRYTEVRPAGARRVSVLNRKQEAQGHGFLGEDLFARSTAIHEEPPGELPNFDNLREQSDNDMEFEASLKGRQTSRDVRTAQRRARAKALQDWAIWEWYQNRWEENEECARPPKEEPLWLRKGDENRGVTAKERFNDAMMKAIFPEGR